jgi:YbbR domain-containing protein
MTKQKEKFKIWHLIPSFIRNNFIRKIVALFFAIFVWLKVDDEITQPDTIRDVEVNLSLPSMLVRLDDNTVKLNINVKASRRILNKLTKDDFNVHINVKDSMFNKFPMSVTHKINKSLDISAPSGVTILNVKPEVVTFTVDKKISKTVPIKLEYSGYLLEEYSYRVVSIIPENVIITGPASIVGSMKFIKSKPIILAPENVDDFEIDAILVSKKNVSMSQKMVAVQIEIFKKFDTTDFANIQIKPLGFTASPAAITFTPSHVTTTLYGIRKSLEILKNSEIHPFVDISNLKVPGVYNLKVQYWVDKEDIIVRGGAPETIKVELK